MINLIGEPRIVPRSTLSGVGSGEDGEDVHYIARSLQFGCVAKLQIRFKTSLVKTQGCMATYKASHLLYLPGCSATSMHRIATHGPAILTMLQAIASI